MSVQAVELGEVVVGGLDLAVLENFKAHADEDVLDLIEHLIHRVLFADLHSLAGDGDVHRLGLELHLQRFCGQLLRARLHALLELGAHLVGKLADHGALLCAERAHLLDDSGQLAPLAEVLHAQRLKVLRLLRAADGLKGFGADGFQFLFHIISPSLSKVPNDGGRQKKSAPSSAWDERALPWYHPNSRRRSARTRDPLTAVSRPRLSSRPLPGEPSDTPQTGFQPPTGPLCAKQARYFPVLCVSLTVIYSTRRAKFQVLSHFFFTALSEMFAIPREMAYNAPCFTSFFQKKVERKE